MNKYDRLVLARHLRRVIEQNEAALKVLQPGTDYYEIAVGDIETARDTLSRLERVGQTTPQGNVILFPPVGQTKR